MPDINYILLIGALLMFGGIVFGASSSRLGIPFLLIFLVVGMLAGEEGPGGISFHNYQLSFLVGNLALAIILLDGGLRTKMTTFRLALKPSITLASLGVIITAALVGLFATLVLNIDWRYGLLIGTIVGSTDAAAVFSLLKTSGTRLNDRISGTLEIESGINDPTAIFLTVVLIDMMMKTHGLSVLAVVREIVQEFGIGCAAGIGFGYLLSAMFKRVQVSEGLHALLLCSGGVVVFCLTNLSGGSGFLAVYLTGLIVGNHRNRVGEDVFRAMDGLAWLAQSSMFLLLGMLVSPSRILESAGPALAIAAFLMLVARPAAVLLSLLPFRFTAKEIVFIAWVGLRGAVPIVMAMFPLFAGLPGADLIFNVAFVVVLTSLLIQGTSVPFLAKYLGISLPDRADPLIRAQLHSGDDNAFELVQFGITDQSDIDGIAPARITLPNGTSIVNIARGGRLLRPDEVAALHPGDIVALIAPEAAIERLAELFHRRHKPGHTAREFYGDFILDSDAVLADVAAMYGDVTTNQALQNHALGDAILAKLRRSPVEGDSVELCGLLFTVRSTNGDKVAQVGMKLPRRKI